jgi:predicted RND superfamily exporter protein
MYEKILALLIAKFAQARKDGLQQLARSLAIQVADETQAQALVEKIEDSQVTTFIKEWRKEVDSEISKGTKSFEENLKTKYDLVEKKTPISTSTTDDKNDIASVVAKAIADAVQPLQAKLTALESGKTSENRKAVLVGKLSGAPETFKNTVLKHFEKMQFATDEEFETFLTETEADSKTIEQELANKGLGFFPQPNVSTNKKNGEAVSSDIADWAKSNKVE